jgi:hypothetical protein
MGPVTYGLPHAAYGSAGRGHNQGVCGFGLGRRGAENIRLVRYAAAPGIYGYVSGGKQL